MGKLLHYSSTVTVPAERYFVLERAKHSALDRFGGFTVVDAVGGYRGKDGLARHQHVVNLTVWSDERLALANWTAALINELKAEGELEVLFVVTGPDGSVGALA